MAKYALTAATGPLARVDLGRVDYCIDVKEIGRSQAFYRKLGFREVEGDPKKGWLILMKGDFRVGLFQGHIEKSMMNFRGGDVPAIVKKLQGLGLKPYDVKNLDKDGSGRAMLQDPDGNEIFFDSTPEERVARVRATKKGNGRRK